ncbi:MAG: allantoate amidohydrolase [Planctomycetes bacterium]|nr:allantoate amidohydrolase [Planctomycetota bacterium]
MNLDLHTHRILKQCDTLAGFSEEAGRLTRTFLSPPMRGVHACLSEWMAEAGLDVRIDAVGNLIGRKPGRRPNPKVFVTGSHVDTVPNAGKYDGILGVLLGLAALRELSDRTFAHAVDLIAFSEEEGIRFSTSYLSSRAVCGTFDFNWLERKDAAGIALAQALRDYGLDPAAIPAAAYPPGMVAGYLEIHIEQGPILESLGLPLGIVDAIIGQSRLAIQFTGQAGHAGTQPMELRRDALAAAAEFVVRVERTARETPGLRATVGSLIVEPGAVNVVPGKVRLTLDVRHAQDAIRHKTVADLVEVATVLGRDRQLGIDLSPSMDQAAVPSDPELTNRLANAVRAAGQAEKRMVSGAGHDAATMASICPMTMLFLRSPGGISHHPREAVLAEDVKVALDVMIRFLEAELDRER